MQDIITIRTRRPKAEIARAAGGNINRWINDLIDNALALRPVDWCEHFKKRRASGDYDIGDEMRRRER